MKTSPELDLTIGSRFEELELVDLLMQLAADWASLPPDDGSDMALAVREAAANAVQHGNRLQDHKRVRICARLDSGYVTVRVVDEGEGFDLSELPDPLAPPNLLKPSGRGIFLMRRLMDEVTFDFPLEGGTVVTMRKDIPESSHEHDPGQPASLSD
jgi:serine/threonine-protein kinase RsbW